MFQTTNQLRLFFVWQPFPSNQQPEELSHFSINMIFRPDCIVIVERGNKHIVNPTKSGLENEQWDFEQQHREFKYQRRNQDV